MTESLGKKTLKGSIWSIFDVVLRQGIGFVLGIILARLLSPSDYGTISMMMIFITISNVFVDGGFSTGLIRKNDRTERDLSTAFIFNICVGILAYVVVFCFAPLISVFFNNNELTLLLRVLALVLIINSFNMVQNAILIYSMKVRQMTIVTAVAQISTGCIAIFLAYEGFGVWTLIIQQISSTALTALLLFVVTKWRPIFVFDKESFRYLWNFGSKLLAANLIGTICNQMYSFVIGKFLGKRELGLYGRSDQFANQSNSIISNVINKALVPSLVKCQNDLNRLKKNYTQCVEILGFLVFPLMFIVSFIGKPLFLILFGTKWQDAIPLFQILCIGYSFSCFSNLSLSLMQIMGRTDYTLKLELFKKPIFFILILGSLSWGLNGLVIGNAIYCLYSTLVNLSVVKFLLKYSYIKQIKDIFKYCVMVISALLPLMMLDKFVVVPNLIQVFLYPICFIILYFLLSYLFKVKAMREIKKILTRNK